MSLLGSELKTDCTDNGSVATEGGSDTTEVADWASDTEGESQQAQPHTSNTESLATLLQEAMQKRDISGLHSAIAITEVVEGVDVSLIQSAKTLLVSVAMERRDVAKLKAAITTAEGEVRGDETMIEVSEGHYRGY